MESESESGQSILLTAWSGRGVENRERPKKWMTLSNTPDPFDIGTMVSACCIIFSPLSLTVTKVVSDCCGFSRANNIDLSKRIIALATGFVHAVIRIGPLDFQRELHETTANECAEGI